MQSNTQPVPAAGEQPQTQNQTPAQLEAQAVKPAASTAANSAPLVADELLVAAELPPVGVHSTVSPASVQSTPAPVASAAPVAQRVLPRIPVQQAAPAVVPQARGWLRERTWLREQTWLRWVGYGVLGLLAIGGGMGYGTYASWRGGEYIAPQFFIQGEPVGGLTRQEARQRLEHRFGRLFLTIQMPDRAFKLGLPELGGQPQFEAVVNKAHSYGRAGNPVINMWRLWQARREEHRLSLPVQWDKEQLKSKMWIVANQYRVEAKDATLRVGDKGAEVVPHQAGRSVNVGATLEKLQRVYYTGLPESEAIVRTVMPRITSDDLVGVDVKLGEYRTSFDSGIGGRTKNIRLASRALDGRVLMPGEMFSFNATTGERTSSKGYRIAHIFVQKPGESESEMVEGLGGGVCQVSSTLFNAVRKTNRKTGKKLRILELNHHSLPVTYVPSGLDATVAWPHKDFRFRNKFPHPIYLRASVDGSRLNISVWGRVPYSRVPSDSSTVSTTQATRPALQQTSNS